MRHLWVSGLLLLALLAPRAQAGPKKAPPPPPPGIRWESSVAGARERAKREGRPLLLCINALEDQVVELVTQLYPSEAWGRATRGYVCLVANPHEHEAKEGLCSRFGHIPCSVHQETLAWILSAFTRGGELISPQHLILEPDGGIAYRKEYFTGEEGPTLFETYLSRLAPDLAVRLAGLEREARIAELAKAPADEVGAAARAWLGTADDGLATAGLLSALLDTEAPARRLALIEAFASAPSMQTPVLLPALEIATYAPDEKPEECLRWVASARAADRSLGAWAASRAIVRTGSAAFRERLVAAWTGAPEAQGAGALAAGERAALGEALRLVGQKVPAEAKADDAEGLESVPALRRARARAKGATGVTPLVKDLASLAPGELRRALLGAAPADVAARETDVAAVLRQAPFARVRVAAAVALLRAKRAVDGAVERALLEALLDVLEGPETRALLAPPRDGDPGDDPEAWSAWIRAQLGEAR